MKKMYKPEKKVFKDDVTGATIWQMTDYPAIHYNLGYLGVPCFTPDGKTLFFVSDRASETYDIFSADMESGEITQLTKSVPGADISPNSQGFSPDGKWLYFSRGAAWVCLNLINLEETKLIEFPGCRFGVFGGFTADGKHTVFKIRHKTTSDMEELFTVELKKPNEIGAIKSILTRPTHMIGAQLVPETTDYPLAYAEFESAIWVIDWDGKNHRRLIGEFGKTFITHSVRFSNKEILTVDWQERALKMVDINTGKVRLVAKTSAFHPTVSPDKSMIACDTAFPDIGIQLIDPNTGKQKTLCYPRASNQGDGWAIGITPAKMLDCKRVIAPGLGPQWTHPHVSFSPDGKKICYMSNHTGFSQIYIAFRSNASN